MLCPLQDLQNAMNEGTAGEANNVVELGLAVVGPSASRICTLVLRWGCGASRVGIAGRVSRIFDLALCPAAAIQHQSRGRVRRVESLGHQAGHHG